MPDRRFDIFGLNLCLERAIINPITMRLRKTSMNLDRRSESEYMAERRAAHEAKVAEPGYIEGRLAVLERLALESSEQGELGDDDITQPNISIDESVAIAFAKGHGHKFTYPVGQFLLLEYWLQAWLLRRWRMEKHIGGRVGVP